MVSSRSNRIIHRTALASDDLDIPLEVQVDQVREPQWGVPFDLYRRGDLCQEPRFGRRRSGVPRFLEKPLGHVEEAGKQPVIVEGLEPPPALGLVPFEIEGIVGADPSHAHYMLLVHVFLVLRDCLEGPRQTEESHGRLATLALPQIGQDCFERLELHEAGEGGDGLDGAPGEHEGRGRLEDLVPMELQGFWPERAGRAFLGLGVDGGKPVQPPVHALPKGFGELLRFDGPAGDPALGQEQCHLWPIRPGRCQMIPRLDCDADMTLELGDLSGLTHGDVKPLHYVVVYPRRRDPGRGTERHEPGQLPPDRLFRDSLTQLGPFRRKGSESGSRPPTADLPHQVADLGFAIGKGLRGQSVRAMLELPEPLLQEGRLRGYLGRGLVQQPAECRHRGTHARLPGRRLVQHGFEPAQCLC